MFEELQSLSETNKMRVLVVGTIIIMVIVVGVWLTYFNSVVLGGAQQTAVQAPPPAAAASTATSATAQAQASGPGIWQYIENGFASFLNIFRNPSQYTIQPK